ncbi:MAG: hypothetical protein RQ753_10415 [Desulfurivibrionaceae bacterium]|nr:hypothetical protein [Desulfurivibrionaceae bacterium]
MLLVALLFSLSAILRQFFVEPGKSATAEVALDESISVARPEFPEKNLYPPVPAMLPDLNENYLFNSERSFAEDVQDAGVAAEPMDLTGITYTGSLIVGQIRIGLITYQEDVSVAGASPAAGQAGSRRRVPTRTVIKNKQLAVGENFMGYVVEEIAKDRLVLKKGDEMIVKFLYDSGKDRAGASGAIRSQPGQSGAANVGLVVRQAPASPAADARQNNLRPGSTPPADHDAPADNRTIRSRTELLRGLAPNLGAPPSSGGPGDPLRR